MFYECRSTQPTCCQMPTEPNQLRDNSSVNQTRHNINKIHLGAKFEILPQSNVSEVLTVIAISQHPKQIITMCLIEDLCCFGGIGQLGSLQRCHTCTCENSIFCAETALPAGTCEDKFPFHISQLVDNCTEIEEGSNENSIGSTAGL